MGDMARHQEPCSCFTWFSAQGFLSHRGFTEGSIDGTWDEFSFSGIAEPYAEQEHVFLLNSDPIQVMFYKLVNR